MVEIISAPFLISGHKWNAANLTFTFLDTGLFSNYSENVVTIIAYNNTGPLMGPKWDSSQGIFNLTFSGDSLVLDQQDAVRFLLTSPTALLAYSEEKTINSTLLKIVVDPSNGENYRVSFPEIIPLSFSEKALSEGKGDILLFNGFSINENQRGISFLPPPGLLGVGDTGDVALNALPEAGVYENSLNIGSNSFFGWLHELGHAVGGLQHDAESFPFNTYLDTQKYTVMSENPYFNLYAYGLQILDVLAIQEQYNARNYVTRSDDTEYSLGHGLGIPEFSDHTPFLTNIWDGGGIDTINVNSFTVKAEVDLRQGHFSSVGYYNNGTAVAFDGQSEYLDTADNGNLSISYYTIIENAIGTNASGTDAQGNPIGDILIGNAWNNRLEGGAGAMRVRGIPSSEINSLLIGRGFL